MKKFYKQLLEALTEARVEGSGLPPSVGLFVLENTMTLYDTRFYHEEEQGEGVLGYLVYTNLEEGLMVNAVAAKKGYGPMMYELLMEHASPRPICSDRDGDTREGAVRIWNYFLGGNNSNVRIQTLTPEDENYVDCLEWGCDDENPDFFKIYNSYFTAGSNQLFTELSQRAKKFATTIKEGDPYDEIYLFGRGFFDMMYD